MRPLLISTVLVATDLHSSSDTVIDPAIDSGHRLAAAAGAALHVVHVDEPAQTSRQSGSPRRSLADALGRALQHAGVPEQKATIHLLAGAPADTIRTLAGGIGADVIVVGPHRPRAAGGSGRSLGGTARDVVLGSTAPCLVATRSLRLPLERVLVPIDLSATARGASLVGLSWASALRAGGTSGRRTTLGLLHVLAADADEASATSSFDRELERVRESAGSWAGLEVEGITLRTGSGPAGAIVECANERRSDLVVVGTRGLGLDDRTRLGSVSAAVIELAEVNVLLVPPSVWQAHAALP
jgi:nucleotide-binding universal stress UspA family protein